MEPRNLRAGSQRGDIDGSKEVGSGFSTEGIDGSKEIGRVTLKWVM